MFENWNSVSYPRSAEGTVAREIHPDDGARIAIGAAHLIAPMKLSGRSRRRLERFRNAVVRSLAGGLARFSA